MGLGHELEGRDRFGSMRWKTLLVAAAGAFALACPGARELELPTEAELSGVYGAKAEVRLNGNVVDVVVRQPVSHLQRGGELWARVGPYVYLLSPRTTEIFRDYDGVAAVRVRTTLVSGTPVAEAMLLRDTLTSITWREAHRRVARALNEGTERPAYLEALVRFGEDYARYEYNPRYVPRR